MTSDIVTIESMKAAEMQATMDQLTQFRQQMYDCFDHRPDAIMSLLDALCSNTTAQSVVQLSLNAVFNHSYNSVYDAIDHFFVPSDITAAKAERESQEQRFTRLIIDSLPEEKRDSFWLFSVDVTPAPRRFACTLADRGYVYAPNTIVSNKPVTIGHQYSALVLHPQKKQPFAPPWVVPLSVRRVSSQQTKQIIGAQQVQALLSDDNLPFGQQLCVQVTDSHYSSVNYLGQMSQYENLITIARVRSNRTFYRQPKVRTLQPQRGHPTWYGERFNLAQPETWYEPNEILETNFTNRRGKNHTIFIEAWYNMLMRGTTEYQMAEHPFTLLRIRRLNEKGELVFTRPLWLLVFGERRDELAVIEIFSSYRQRLKMELKE